MIDTNTASLGANWQLQFVQPDGLPLTMQSFEVIDFGAISYTEIFQNVKTILATPLFSAALERTLGLDNTIVDRPITEAARITVAILDAVVQWEPRCDVMNIDFAADAINGHLIVKLQLNIKNVIYGTNTPYTATNIYPPPRREPMIQEPVQGPPGPPGPPGPRGSLWFVGTGDPPSSVTPGAPQPQAQDMYLNTTTGDIFQFQDASGTTTGGWQVVVTANKAVQEEMIKKWRSQK
jgi:phage baseplate assembly protein W